MLIAPDAALAPIYYKAGNLYKARKYQTDAIECYQTVLENFADTAIAPKAVKELKALTRTFDRQLIGEKRNLDYNYKTHLFFCQPLQ